MFYQGACPSVGRHRQQHLQYLPSQLIGPRERGLPELLQREARMAEPTDPLQGGAFEEDECNVFYYDEFLM